MKRKVILSGDGTEQALAHLRTLAGTLGDVDIQEEAPVSSDPLQDIVFWMDRIAAHSGRSANRLTKLSGIDSKLSRISISLESLVIVQRERLALERERLAFEQKQALERASIVRK